jgi:hypothetical protein
MAVDIEDLSLLVDETSVLKRKIDKAYRDAINEIARDPHINDSTRAIVDRCQKKIKRYTKRIEQVFAPAVDPDECATQPQPPQPSKPRTPQLTGNVLQFPKAPLTALKYDGTDSG